MRKVYISVVTLCLLAPSVSTLGSVYIVDLGFVEIDSIESEQRVFDEHSNSELDALVSHFTEHRESIEAASKRYLRKLTASMSDAVIVERDSESLDIDQLDPKSVFVWMLALRDFAPSLAMNRNDRGRTFQVEWYLLNPATQLIAFRQSATISLKAKGLSFDNGAALLDKCLAAIETAVSAEANAAARFENSLMNFSKVGLSSARWAIDPSQIKFDETLVQKFREGEAYESKTFVENLMSRAKNAIGAELNNILSGERNQVMLPMLPDELLSDMRLGTVNDSNYWIIFRTSSSETENLDGGAFDYDHTLSILRIKAKLPRPDYFIGAEVNYKEAPNGKEKIGRFWVDGAMEVRTKRILSRGDRQIELPLVTLHGASANTHYPISKKFVENNGLKGFYPAIASLYKSYQVEK